MYKIASTALFRYLLKLRNNNRLTKDVFNKLLELKVRGKIDGRFYNSALILDNKYLIKQIKKTNKLHVLPNVALQGQARLQQVLRLYAKNKLQALFLDPLHIKTISKSPALRLAILAHLKHNIAQYRLLANIQSKLGLNSLQKPPKNTHFMYKNYIEKLLTGNRVMKPVPGAVPIKIADIVNDPAYAYSAKNINTLPYQWKMGHPLFFSPYRDAAAKYMEDKSKNIFALFHRNILRHEGNPPITTAHASTPRYQDRQRYLRQYNATKDSHIGASADAQHLLVADNTSGNLDKALYKMYMPTDKPGYFILTSFKSSPDRNMWSEAFNSVYKDNVPVNDKKLYRFF